jgi:hypothetical protein
MISESVLQCNNIVVYIEAIWSIYLSYPSPPPHSLFKVID